MQSEGGADVEAARSSSPSIHVDAGCTASPPIPSLRRRHLDVTTDMTERLCSSRRTLLISLAALAASPRARGQTASYPLRPVKLIVPNAPASSVDTIARLVSNLLAPLLQQAIVVETVPALRARWASRQGARQRPTATR